jgi:hypothetical protein
VRQFLLACFSAILTSATGRKGKQHGFFADNTPLPAGSEAPEYENAVSLFLTRVSRNTSILERFYASLERDDKDPAAELRRAHVIQVNAMAASPDSYGVAPKTVAGIITSPPYLCMSDYTLGQRLSYYWIDPTALDVDFASEIGARRRRTQPQRAAQAYFESLECFANTASSLLRPGGFLAVVLGAPVAASFANLHVVETVDRQFAKKGFCKLWETKRRIHWHRNHGYQRLRLERLAVYALG